MRRYGISRPQIAVSFIILFYLVLQFLTGFSILPNSERYYWPFLYYPMYGKPHFEGDTMDQYTVYGLLEKGDAVPIKFHDLGFPWRQFFDKSVDKILKNDTAEIEKVRQLYEKNQGVPLKGISIKVKKWKLKKNGIDVSELTTLKEIWFNTGKGHELNSKVEPLLV
jgi:hypothetical protein